MASVRPFLLQNLVDDASLCVYGGHRDALATFCNRNLDSERGQ